MKFLFKYPANHYITIGTHIWMVENLKTRRYQNGVNIDSVDNATTWSGLTTGAYCNYNNDANIVATYGRLYNWFAVNDSRNIAPTGWHVPTDEDWKTLEIYLGMSQQQADGTDWKGTDQGSKLKESGPLTGMAQTQVQATPQDSLLFPAGSETYPDHSTI
jgi:uncharacterized protein (TIGR02145 family)